MLPPKDCHENFDAPVKNPISEGYVESAMIHLLRASEKINWTDIAPDFGSVTRRVDGFILVVWDH